MVTVELQSPFEGVTTEAQKERNRESVRRYRARTKNDPVRIAARKASQARDYAKHRDVRIADVLARIDRNPDAVRNRDLQRKYGITLADFNAMVEAQAGLCAICCEPMNPYRDTNVDHCHKTGKVRGLLCNCCNTRLGRMEADVLLTQASLSYAGVSP